MYRFVDGAEVNVRTFGLWKSAMLSSKRSAGNTSRLRNQFAQLNTTLEDYGTRRPVFAGAGHDGLVTPAYLAQAGRRVLVLERRELLGGCSDTEEVWPGYRV